MILRWFAVVVFALLGCAACVLAGRVALISIRVHDASTALLCGVLFGLGFYAFTRAYNVFKGDL